MIYTIIDEKGDPVNHPHNARPFESNDPYAVEDLLKRCRANGEKVEVKSFTNVELLELWVKVQELRRYLETEKFSKEEWVDRKDVLRRLGF